MDKLLTFDSAFGNALDWLEFSHSDLAEINRQTEGQWEEVKLALEKLDAAMVLLREVRIPLLPAIAAAQEDVSNWEDMADAYDAM